MGFISHCRKRVILCSFVAILVQICEGISITKVDKKACVGVDCSHVTIEVHFDVSSADETCTATWMDKNGKELPGQTPTSGIQRSTKADVETDQLPATVVIGTGMEWTRLTIRETDPGQDEHQESVPVPNLQINPSLVYGSGDRDIAVTIKHPSDLNVDLWYPFKVKPLFADVFMYIGDKIIKSDMDGSGLFYADSSVNGETEVSFNVRGKPKGILALTYDYEESSAGKLVHRIQVGRSEAFHLDTDAGPFSEEQTGVAHPYYPPTERVTCRRNEKCEISCVAASSGNCNIEVTLSEKKDGNKIKLVSATHVSGEPITRIAFPANGMAGADYVCEVRDQGQTNVIDSLDINLDP